MVRELESLTQRTAQTELLPFQDGDVLETYADITAAARDLEFMPKTSLREGLDRFVEWYKGYYRQDR